MYWPLDREANRWESAALNRLRSLHSSCGGENKNHRRPAPEAWGLVALAAYEPTATGSQEQSLTPSVPRGSSRLLLLRRNQSASAGQPDASFVGHRELPLSVSAP